MAAVDAAALADAIAAAEEASSGDDTPDEWNRDDVDDDDNDDDEEEEVSEEKVDRLLAPIVASISAERRRSEAWRRSAPIVGCSGADRCC